MAKLKKNARSKAAGAKRASAKPAGTAAELQARAEQVSRSIVGSAQQIWMAGMGAFHRAQGEGSKLFEALVKEGMNIEQSTRNLATRRVDAVRDAVEDRVGVARERAVDTWDRLEKVFEDRVQRALNRLGVPGREDLAELSKRVNELNAELRKLSGGSTRAKPKAKPARKAKPAAKKAARKAAAKPAAKPKKAAKAARKRALPKSPKPVAPQQAG